ncbi:MFS general substrate transporter [Mycena galericulata]|nr:MFS general substrate transporter [Mycena galericulata]
MPKENLREIEKAGVSVDEATDVSSHLDALPEIGTSERILAERKLVRKLDSRLLPTIFLIYIMNYIDKNGITTARLEGLEKDLGLSDLQYNVVLSILFVSYSPAQIPSNMILNRVTRPSWYIAGCVIAWGLTSLLTGITKNYGGILACRIFIGLPEASFYPGDELAFRAAIFYSGQIISSAFGALIAAGILANMEGKLGIRAWRWYPNNTRWIVGDERRLAQARLAEDTGEADQDNIEDTPFAGLKMALRDPVVLTFSVMNAAQLLGLSFVFFCELTQALGFSTTISLLLAAPPWILAALVCCLNAWHAGLAMTAVWVSNVIPRPPSKRAAAIAIVNGVGNLGNLGVNPIYVKMGSYVVIGIFLLKSEWSPFYHQSMIISLCALVLSTVMSLGIRQHLLQKNKHLDEDERVAMREAAVLEGISFEQAMERRKGFRYLY